MTSSEPQAPGVPGEFIRDPGEIEWRRDPAAITNEEPAADSVEAQSVDPITTTQPLTESPTDGI